MSLKEVTTRIPLELLAAIEQRAVETKQTRTQVIRNALDLHFGTCGVCRKSQRAPFDFRCQTCRATGHWGPAPGGTS